ncbi:uncharacterized protein LOC118336212 [Morone saxatilis]|uniref:uncharacterized protein LOC118336212 n=1 Tax=Morone saxatilis TaxID=34816 RepID=UPI0015E23FC3|nr:uncharacterized protein LOC118336212 [Morone saxatilis]
MENRRKGEMRRKRKVPYICWLLLALLQIATPSSAQDTNTTTSAAALRYLTRPVDVRVAVGEPAVFLCGVPIASPNLTFTFYRTQKNYSLTCPYGYAEDIPQALYGSCEMKKGESLAVWTLKGTSFSDNGTRVVCQQSNNMETHAAILRVYDSGISHATLIGCTIGGFFGVVLVAGLSYTMLQRSETLQKCFRGKETEEDVVTIVTKD